MEDPVRFDVWGTIRRELLGDAVAALKALPQTSTERDVRLSANRSAVTGTPLRILAAAGWAEAKRLADDPPAWATAVRVYQAGYGPADLPGLGHCPRHDLYYGGCLGCHVCTGFCVR